MLHNELTKIPSLSPAAIFDYINNYKKLNLTDSARNEIERSFGRYDELQRLADLMTEINLVAKGYEQLGGLTEQQKELMSQLIAEEQSYHERYDARKATHRDYKKYIADQQTLSRLRQTLEWWKLNNEEIQSDTFWESLNVATKKISKNNHESSRKARKRLHKILDIKEDYEKYQPYMLYTAENLIAFYNDHLLPLETIILSIQKKRRQLPVMISEYLGYLLNQLQEQKKLIIYSAIFRLKAAEYFNDVGCDDLMSYTSNRIYSYANVYINRSGNIPSRRRSLNPEKLNQLVDMIRGYQRSNNICEEINSKSNELPFLIFPVEFSSTLATEKDKKVLSNPSILYLLNSFEHIINKIDTCDHISDIINYDPEKPTLLDKLDLAIKHAEQELIEIAPSVEDVTANKVKAKISEYHKKLNDRKERINIDTINQCQQQIDELMIIIFSNESIALHDISDRINLVTNINRHVNKLSGTVFSAGTDIRLVLATKIAKTVNGGHALTENNIHNIIKLLDELTNHDQKRLTLRTHKLLSGIDRFIKPSAEYREAELLHLILNMMEIPFDSENELNISLARHEHISRIYNETNTLPHSQDNLTLSYIKSVYLRIINLSPVINPNEFDNNEIIDMIRGISTEIGSQSLEEIQEQIEQHTLKRLNIPTILYDYLFNNAQNPLNHQKLGTLLTRIDAFFTKKEYGQKLRDTINNVVFTLLKKHLIDVITQQAFLNPDQFTMQTATQTKEMLNRLKNDTDIQNAIINVIKRSDGTSSSLLSLFILLEPLTDNLRPFAEQYQNQRLQVACTLGHVSRSDFLYFSQHKPKTHYKNIKTTIDAILNDNTTNWNPANASFIETFGNEKDVVHYRTKGVQQFIRQIEAGDIPTDSEAQYSTFMNSAWRVTNANNYLLDPKTKLSDGKSISQHIDIILSSNTWNPFIDKFTQSLGTPDQLQKLRQLLNEKLNITSDDTKSIDNKLSYLIIMLVDIVKKFQASDTLSPNNILSYLMLIDNNILTPLETELSGKSNPISINMIHLLMNTLSYFMSETVKFLLINNQQSMLDKSPFTYHLINHLGQNRYLKDIPEGQLNNNIQAQYIHALGSRIGKVKQLSKQRLKFQLFKTAGISIDNELELKFNSKITMDKLNDSQLIKLWLQLAENLNATLLDNQSSPAYILKLIKYLGQLSSQLRSKLANNIGSHDFKKIIALTASLKAALTAYYKANQSNAELQYLQRQSGNLSGILSPVLSQIDLLFIDHCKQQIDTYLDHKLHINHNNRYELFTQLSYGSLLPSSKLKSALKLKHHTDSFEAQTLLKIQKKINAIIEQKQEPASLTTYLAQVQLEISNHPQSLRLKHFNRHINKLTEDGSLYFAQPGFDSQQPAQIERPVV